MAWRGMARCELRLDAGARQDLLRERNGEVERGAARWTALDPDSAPMRVHDAFDDVEPESCAAGCSGILLPEPFKQMRNVVRRNSGPGVRDAEADAIACPCG